MDCSDFKKCIAAFAKQELKPKQAEECLKHVRECSSCMDELEIYFIVEHVKEENAYDGPFVIKDIVNECFNKVQRGIKNSKRRARIIRAVKLLINFLLILAIIAVMTISF